MTSVEAPITEEIERSTHDGNSPPIVWRSSLDARLSTASSRLNGPAALGTTPGGRHSSLKKDLHRRGVPGILPPCLRHGAVAKW